MSNKCKIRGYVRDIGPRCPFPVSRSPAEIPPRIPGLMVSGRWGNDLTTIPNPVNRDMDSTHRLSTYPRLRVAVTSIARRILRTILWINMQIMTINCN